MTYTKRLALVLVIGAAIGLMATAAFAQERHGPPGGPPPDSSDVDEHVMQPGPGMRPGDDERRPEGGPHGPRAGMQQHPGLGGPLPGGGPMQGGPGGVMPPPGMMGGPGGPMGFDMQKRDPEMFKLIKEDMLLEEQSRELAMQYRHASTEDREKIKKQVVEIVTKQFEVRQQRRSLEVKRLEDALKNLRGIVERRAKAREKLVEKRVADLVGPEEPEVQF